jgi:hypothetical protein
MHPLLKELRHNPMLWLLAMVPVALVAAKLVPRGHYSEHRKDEHKRVCCSTLTMPSKL